MLYSLTIDGVQHFGHTTLNVIHDYLDRYSDADEIIIRKVRNAPKLKDWEVEILCG